jgi:hypothetical protein
MALFGSGIPLPPLLRAQTSMLPPVGDLEPLGDGLQSQSYYQYPTRQTPIRVETDRGVLGCVEYG